MNENLNLVEILDGCPKGTELYSTVYGKVQFERIINYDSYPIEIKVLNKFTNPSVISAYITKDGRCTTTYDGDCTLFPAKDQRSWSKFERFWDKPKVEKFNPKTLQPFDKVLGRDNCGGRWKCGLFSHNMDESIFPYVCIGNSFIYCIPYNDDTKHLLGTTELPSKYYRYWEE